MFIYWNGYEIDGSDTDFDIVLPENVQVWEFVECFLSLPIFNHSKKPEISWYQNRKQKKLTVTALKEKLLSGDYPVITVSINCLLMEQMPEELQRTLYSISERRDPHEEAYGKTEHPCMAPVIQNDYYRGEMTVELRIQKPGTKNWVIGDDETVTDDDGYVHNIELFNSAGTEPVPAFALNVGPSFYYEYAIYIIDQLRDSFPGLGTCGGLDCHGGWTEGCTYADSIYGYEKIQLPVKYSIKNMLKRLTEYNIVRSYKSYYKKGWQYEYTNGFNLVNYALTQNSKQPDFITFEQYNELVEMALSLNTEPFAMVCDTAISIKLPSPEEFAQNPEVEKKLRRTVPELSRQNGDWQFTGYFAFTVVSGNPVAEFRVNYKLKPYLMTLLELAELGEIEFMKAVTYERRQND